MIGRELDELYPRLPEPPHEHAEPVLSVSGLGRGEAFTDVSFELGRGEILGVAGLVGSGRSELLMALVGAEPADRGSIILQGQRVRLRSARRAQRLGVVLVPESRKTQGLHLDHSIERNITLPHLSNISVAGVVSPWRSREVAERGITRTRVKTPDVRVPTRTLSGGNQQRALFAKWLVEDPKVLLVDEPTRGVDVQGKHAIYEILAELARKGTSIIVVSSEANEIIGLSHRVLVMHRGRVAAELQGECISEQAIVTAAFGTKAAQEGVEPQ
jgi:ABC-type sugar transport system ATPase subunit